MKKIKYLAFVILLVGLLVVSGCIQEAQKPETNITAETAIEETAKNDLQPLEECKYLWPPDCNYILDSRGRETCEKCTGQKTQQPTPPSRINLSFVKAMWFYSILEFEPEPMKDPERLRKNGVNTIAIEIEYRFNEKGERVTYLGKGFEEEEKQIVDAIRKYKKKGFAIFFFTQLRYMPKAEEFEAQPIAESLRSDKEFFDRFNSFVLHIADIAEKENVEFFAPTNEPDYMMGDERAKIWNQEILPLVRQHFTGKLILKSASVPSTNVAYFNFSGYDVAGVTIVVLSRGEYNETEYRQMVKTVIKGLEDSAKRDGVPEIWISGFGTWEGIQNYQHLTEKQKADIYQIVFEEAEGHVTGLVPWENTFFPLKDTLSEKAIGEWFTERIKDMKKEEVPKIITNLTYYKGLVVHSMQISNPAEIINGAKKLNANIISIFQETKPEFLTNFEKLKTKNTELIEEAHKNNLLIQFMLPCYFDSNKSADESLIDYIGCVRNYAKFAEEKSVYHLTLHHELDVLVSVFNWTDGRDKYVFMEKASKEALKEVRKYYKGKVGIGFCCTNDEYFDYDFSGYDYYLGMFYINKGEYENIGAFAKNPDAISKWLKRVKRIADSYQIKIIILGETGVCNPDIKDPDGRNECLYMRTVPATTEEEALYYKTLFEKTHDVINGYFIFYEFPIMSIKDEKSEDVILEWYEKLAK